MFSPQRYFNIDPNTTQASGHCGSRESNLLLNFQGGFVNLTFTKVRAGLSYTSWLQHCVPLPSPRGPVVQSHTPPEVRGNISEPFERFSDKHEGHGDGEEGSVDILMFAFFPLQPPLCSSGGPLMPLTGDLALRNLDTGALCKPPKGGSCTDERPTEIPSGYQRNRIVLRPKPNVRIGSFQPQQAKFRD